MLEDLLSDRTHEIFAAVFARMDVDVDGYISIVELDKVMQSLGQSHSKAELVMMITEVDADGDGTIDFPEFINLLLRNGDSPVLLTAMFLFYDLDGNGFISASELKQVMSGLGRHMSDGDEEVDEVILEVDADGDGQISYDKFVKMMT